jgi:hypothetical protein
MLNLAYETYALLLFFFKNKQEKKTKRKRKQKLYCYLEKNFAINAKSAFIVMLDAYSLLQKID